MLKKTIMFALVLGLTCGGLMGGTIFSVDHNNLPAVGESVTAWDGFSQRGGDPTVVDLGGEKWMQNLRNTSDRLRHDSGGHGTTPIPIDGATIVTAIKPIRHASGNPWTSIVDIFYDQLCIGVMNETGQIKVKVSGANGANPIWTSAADKVLPEEPGVLSLSVDDTGAFEVFWRGENDETAVSMGTGNGNLAGADYDALYPSVNSRGYAQYINLGGNDPDGWPIFNGLIGDTYVYDNQLSPEALVLLQDEVHGAMGLSVFEPDPVGINLPNTTVVATATSTLALATDAGATVALGGIDVNNAVTLTVDSPSTDFQLTDMTLGAGSTVLSTEAAANADVTITVGGTLAAGGGVATVGDENNDINSTNVTLGDGSFFDWTFSAGDDYVDVNGEVVAAGGLTIQLVDGGGSSAGADVALFRALDATIVDISQVTVLAPVGLGWTWDTDGGGNPLLTFGGEFLVLEGLVTGAAVVPGDTNGDGIVNDADLANLEAQFGGAPGAESADFDGDGDVDAHDFATMRGNWGFGTGPAPLPGGATPEPATMTVLALGGLVLLRRRRKA